MNNTNNLQDLLTLLNPIVDYQNDSNQQFSSTLELIEQHLQSTYPTTNIVVESYGQSKHQFTMPLENFGEMFGTNIYIQIDFARRTLDIQVQFAEHYERLQVKSKMIRLQLGRYMLRLNNNMRVGSFYINPINGYIGLKMMTLKDLNFQTKLFSPETYHRDLFPYLDSLIYTSLQTLRFHFMRILFLINQLKIREFPLYETYMEKDRRINQWRKFPPETKQLLQRIKETVKNDMHTQFSVKQYEDFGPILKKSMMSDQKCLIEIDFQMEQSLFETKINEGGFCNIYTKDLSYTKNGEKFKRFLVIKQEKSATTNKISNEIKILKQLAQINTEINQEGDRHINKTGCCPFIAQFYHLKDQENLLLMERYFHSSLDYYKEKQQETLSLSSIVYIAYQVAMGLRYCHSYGIVHMDIKPANILISKALVAKICDFGEAINLREDEKIQAGRTYPYAAPELVQKKKITTAYDIFSFGTMLFELIFNRYPIDYNQNQRKNFESKLMNNSYFVRYDEEYANTIGPQQIIKYLGRMCIQCLEPDPEKRPKIDKICLVLKDCMTYLDKVY